MRISISREDWTFLDRVQELGSRGKSQEQIADALGLSLGSLKYRLAGIGFKVEPGNVLRVTLTGEFYADLLARGEIIPADAAEPAIAGGAS